MIKLILQYGASILPKSILQEKELKKYNSFLQESEHWDKYKVENFVNEQLQLLIEHCYKNVPFYTEMFDEHGIDYKSIKNINDLKKIPVIDKQIVKENHHKFIASNFDVEKLNKMHTGGTTSSPLHFYNTKITNIRETSFYNRIWKKYGYTQNEKCLILRGNTDVDEVLYRYNPLRKWILVNTKNMDDSKMSKIVDLIQKKKPAYMQAYPSLVYLLAKYINKNYDLKIGNFKVIFCASEKMFDFQRREIKKAFGCEVVDYYGHNERLVLMERINEIDKYRIIPEYGICEILDEKGNNITKEGNIGEIVGTGFNNYAFPLVRYRTGDKATVSTHDNKEMYTYIKDIDGRSGDFVITKSGKHYSPTVLEFAIDNMRNFKDIQLVQTDFDNIDVLIEPDTNFKMDDSIAFKKEILSRIDDDININIKIVDKIQKPKNQKSRFILSHVK